MQFSLAVISISLIGCTDAKTNMIQENSNNIDDYTFFYSAKYNNCFNIQEQKQFKRLKDDILEKYNGKAKYINKNTVFISSDITGKNVFIFTKSLKSCEILID